MTATRLSPAVPGLPAGSSPNVGGQPPPKEGDGTSVVVLSATGQQGGSLDDSRDWLDAASSNLPSDSPAGPSSLLSLAHGSRRPVTAEAGRHAEARVGTRTLGGTPLEVDRQLVQRLFLSPGGQARPTTILFAAVDGHGMAGAVCAGVAEVLAEQVDGSVCVVDADLREPSLDGHFGVAADRGLADLFRDGGAARDVALQARANLWVVPAGSARADPATLFGFDRIRSVFGDLRDHFKYVLVHAAPLAEYSESVLLSQWTDGVVLVVEAHRTHRGSARRVKDRLEIVRVPLLAVVLTNQRPTMPRILQRWL